MRACSCARQAAVLAIASFLIQCASRRAAGALPIYRVLKVRQKKATSDGVISSFLLLFFSCLSPSPSPLFFFFFSSSLFLFSLSVLPLFFFSSFLFLVFFSLSFPSFSSEELLHDGSTFRGVRRGRARKPPHACSLLSPPPRTLVSVERAQFPQHRVHGGERVEATAAGCKPRQHPMNTILPMENAAWANDPLGPWGGIKPYMNGVKRDPGAFRKEKKERSKRKKKKENNVKEKTKKSHFHCQFNNP